MNYIKNVSNKAYMFFDIAAHTQRRHDPQRRRRADRRIGKQSNKTTTDI